MREVGVHVHLLPLGTMDTSTWFKEPQTESASTLKPHESIELVITHVCKEAIHCLECLRGKKSTNENYYLQTSRTASFCAVYISTQQIIVILCIKH
jgi:hypothetical protein